MRTEQQLAYHRAYMREYRKRPEVRKREKAKKRDYNRRPEVLEKRREYKRAYNKRPEALEKRRVYNREYMRRIFSAARAARAAGLEASP